MKILCTKEEFAQMIDDCAFNRVEGDKCAGCFFRKNAKASDDDMDACAAALVRVCEIVSESEAE